MPEGHCCREIRRLVGDRCIGVHEIHPGLCAALLEQWAGLSRLQLTPAHVRNPFALLIREALNGSFEESQACGAAFIAVFEQQLQAQANPEQGAFVVVPAA